MDLTKTDWRAIQRALNIQRGIDTGRPDGAVGRKTRTAITRFQRDNKIQETGFIDFITIKSLANSAAYSTSDAKDWIKLALDIFQPIDKCQDILQHWRGTIYPLQIKKIDMDESRIFVESYCQDSGKSDPLDDARANRGYIFHFPPRASDVKDEVNACNVQYNEERDLAYWINNFVSVSQSTSEMSGFIIDCRTRIDDLQKFFISK